MENPIVVSAGARDAICIVFAIIIALAIAYGLYVGISTKGLHDVL